MMQRILILCIVVYILPNGKIIEKDGNVYNSQKQLLITESYLENKPYTYTKVYSVLREGSYNTSYTFPFNLSDKISLCIKFIFAKIDYKILRVTMGSFEYNIDARQANDVYYWSNIINNTYTTYGIPKSDTGYCFYGNTPIDSNTMQVMFTDGAATGGQCGIEVYIA